MKAFKVLRSTGLGGFATNGFQGARGCIGHSFVCDASNGTDLDVGALTTIPKGGSFINGKCRPTRAKLFRHGYGLLRKVVYMGCMASLREILRPSLSTRPPKGVSHDYGDKLPKHGMPVARHEQLFDDVGQFLFSNGLDPNPRNYELAYEFCTAHNVELVKAVQSEIPRTGRLTADAAERILAASARTTGVDILSAFAEQIEAQAKGLTDIAIQSAEDAGTFRAELEGKCEAEVDASQILELTKAMVSRTRLAELQLRQAHTELGVLKSSLAEAQLAADIDSLTGLFNRRAFKRHLEKALELATGSGEPVSIAFCDIDHFKRFNDLHGHATGDRVLRYVASMLEKETKGAAFVGRFGGEEFVVALPGLSLNEAFRAIDQTRTNLSKRRLRSAADNVDLGSICFSAGVSTFGSADSMTEMLRRADDALYKAKSSGRNRVEQE